MKLYKPLFSLIIITVQLLLSLKSYYDYLEWGKSNPQLDGLINRVFLGDSLFLFVSIIGFCEMLTKPGILKAVIRIILILIVLGIQISDLIPMEELYYPLYNTAWFLAAVAAVLILYRMGNYFIGKLNNKKLEKASR